MSVLEVGVATKRHLQSAYSENIFPLIERRFPDLIRIVREKIKDLPVVDVGGGQSQLMEDFCLGSGVTRYINVDIEPHLNSPKAGSEYVISDIESYLLSGVRFQAGVNFCLNGIELALFDGFDELEFILLQIMKKGNIVFGIKASRDSDVSSIFNRSVWKVVCDNELFFIFEKK